MSPERQGTLSFINGSGNLVDFGYYNVSDITEEKNKLRILVGDDVYTIPLVEPKKADSGIRITDGSDTYEISTAAVDLIESFEDSNWFDDWEEEDRTYGDYGRTDIRSIDGSYSLYHTGDTGSGGFSIKKIDGDYVISEGEIVSGFMWSGENSAGVVPNVSLGGGNLSGGFSSGTGLFAKMSPYNDALGIYEYAGGNYISSNDVSVNIKSDTWYKVSLMYKPGDHKAKLYDLNNNILKTVSYNGDSVTGDKNVWLNSSGYDGRNSTEKRAYFDYIKREEDFVNY